MKIEKLHLNKIKVTLTAEDLIRHNITAQAFRENNPCVQKVMLMIMRRAELEAGFVARNCKLTVQAFPGADDSMVMYISKSDACDVAFSGRTLPGCRPKVRLSERSEPRLLCLSFSSFDDVVSFAHFTSDSFGTLYFYNDRYHLIASADKSPWFTPEFGTVTTDTNACLKIAEHGKKICDDALETVRKYF